MKYNVFAEHQKMLEFSRNNDTEVVFKTFYMKSIVNDTLS